MREPVNTSDGHTYEREAIEKWLETHNTSPLAGSEPLESKKLTPVVLVRNSIEKLLQSNPELRDSEDYYLPQSWIMALACACEEGDEAAIRGLVSKDRRLLVHTFGEGVHEGKTALQMAVLANTNPLKVTATLEVILGLMESREAGLSEVALMEPNAQGLLPLHQAILAKQDSSAVLTLMKHMAQCLESVDVPQIDWTPDASALESPLFGSVQQCDITKVACLLRLRANPNATGNSRTCVLNMAIEKVASQSLNSLEIMKLLLQSGANPNSPSSAALHLAIRHNLFEVAVELKKAGAKLDTRLEGDGTTPLHLVAGHMNTRLANELWPDDVKLSLTELEVPCGERGNTALHCAAQAGSVEMLQWLVARGAQITVENALKQTILHLAAQNDHKQFAEAVLHGMGGLHLLDSADNKGDTALHLAAQAGWIDVVTWLLEMGASVSMNQAGKRPRDLLADVKSELGLLTAYDKTQAMLKAKEDSVMLQQGPMGALLLKQQRIIEAQQARLEQQEQDLKLLKQLKDRASVEQLFKHMSNREHDSARALIQDNPALLYCKGGVNHFENSFIDITPLQHAVCTLDWSMWKVILEFLPSEEADRQYQDLEKSHSRNPDWQSIKMAISTKGTVGDAVRASCLLSGPITRVWKSLQSFPSLMDSFIASVEDEGDDEYLITYENENQERVLIRQKKQEATYCLLRYDVLEGKKVTCNRSLRLSSAHESNQVLLQFRSEYFSSMSLDDLIEEQQTAHEFFAALQSTIDDSDESWNCPDCVEVRVPQCKACHRLMVSKGMDWKEIIFDWAQSVRQHKVESEVFSLAGHRCRLRLLPFGKGTTREFFVGTFLNILDLSKDEALTCAISLSIKHPTDEAKALDGTSIFTKAASIQGFWILPTSVVESGGFLSDDGELTVEVGLQIKT